MHAGCRATPQGAGIRGDTWAVIQPNATGGAAAVPGYARREPAAAKPTNSGGPMYIPQHFRENDPDKLAAFLDAHAFGTLTTVAEGKPFATHIPFIYERAENVLWGHVARANPQWQHFTDSPDVLVMFLGPHGYISPTWYATPGVPTWNYTAVHVYGAARAVDDPAQTAKHVERLAERYERGSESPWVPSYDPKRLAGIVGVEIRIKEIQGKFKLSQNRPTADRANVVARLAATGTDNDAELARLVAAAGSGAEQGARG